jgi:thiamine-phosphate pyrophosphorylase
VAPREPWRFDLYVLTDLEAARGDAPYLEAVASGVPGLALQVRDRGASIPELARRLRALVAAARRHAVPVLLGVPDHDRLTLAAEAGIDGVHLPERGPSVEQVRAALGREAWIGASVHDARGVARRVAEGADFLVLGPIGPVPSKGAPLSDEAFGAAVREAGAVPVLALGGVRDEADVSRVVSRGARGVAVLSALAQSTDGAATARRVRGWLDGAARFSDHAAASR